MKVSLNKAAELIELYARNNIVPFVKGSPGIGKSAIVREFLRKYKLMLIDLRLAEYDPIALTGFPFLENGYSKFAPVDLFPTEDWEIPEGYNGWVIFLDELTHAPAPNQNWAYKLILDRMVGQKKLHSKVLLIAAGNLDTDNAHVEPLSTALASRMAVFETYVDHREWAITAVEAGIDHRVVSYINFNPASLFTFNPESEDINYACPRTWFMANPLILGKSLSKDAVTFLSPLVSEGVAREFVEFCNIYTDLPSFDEIVSNPYKPPISERMDVQWATLGMVSQHVTEETIEPVCDFITRYPGEVQVLTMKQLLKRKPSLVDHPSVDKWFNTAGALL